MVSAAAVVGGVLSLPLLLGLTYVGGDFVRSDMAYLCELQRRVAGNLLIAPHIGNGQPMFADPQFQLLYPFRWLATLFAPDLGASVGAVLQLALGAAGAAWLLRSHGVKAFTAACLAIAFAFSGTALNLTWHAAYLSGAAWLPWAWASGRRLLQGARGPWVPGALFASAALLLLGGDPQALAAALVALSLEAAVRIARPSLRKEALRRSLQVGLLCVGAVGVGLLQWLPTSAELELTGRSGALDVREVLRWSFSPPQWLAAIAPGILNERVAPGTSFWLLWFGPSALAPWNGSPYFGPLLLVAASLGLRHRRAWVACALGLMGLLISLGDSLPLLPALLDAVPALGLFRYPSKLLLPVTLAAAVAAGVTLQALGRSLPSDRRAFVRAGGAAAIALGAGAVCTIVLRSTLDGWAAAAPASEVTGGALPSLSTLFFLAMLQGAAPLGAAVALVAVRPTLARSVPLLLCADLFLAAPTAISVGPRLDTVVSPFSALGSRGSDVLLCHSAEVFKVTVRLKEETGVWSENFSLRALAAPNLSACDGVSSPVAYSVVQTRLNARLEAALLTRSAAAARALGCTHLVAPQPPADEPSHLIAIPALGGPLVRVSKIDDPVPAAFVIAAPRLVEGEAELVQLILGAHSASAVLSLLDDPLGRVAQGAQLPGSSDVQVDRRPGFNLDLRGSGGAVVGVRTSFQAGWVALQAGRELPVIRAAGAHLAVVVDDVTGGPVRLEYRIPRWRQAVALAAAGVCVAWVVVLGLRRRRGSR